MNFEPGYIYFNKIYIVQSLRNDDRLTGQELYEDIIRRRISNSLVAEVKNITSKSELIAYFKIIYNEITSGLYPLIHFETHGFKEGIELSNRDQIVWAELVPYFRQINIATKNNLFISMAACQGGNVQFCVKITEPAPFRGFIGPMQDVKDYDVLNSFSEFFNILLLENDVDKAIGVLNTFANGTQYHYMNVEAFFDIALERHQKLWRETPRNRSS